MKIVILGSGHVATQLSKALLRLGHTVSQVYSRNKANAQALALVLNTEFTTDIRTIPTDADLYLLAVSDQAIPPLAAQLPQQLQGLVVHCSGATDIAVLHAFRHYGVIYPPQSITKDSHSQLDQIPFAIEGNNAETATQLMTLMRGISASSFYCSSQQRLALHTAAVFANNFSNALFQISYDILQAHNLSFDLLKPIILETANKVQTNIPATVQTGPAIRSDSITLAKHLQFLSEMPHWLKIYQQLTEEITRKRDK